MTRQGNEGGGKFDKCMSLQKMESVSRNSVFVIISAFCSSRIKSKSFESVLIATILSRLYVIVLEINSFVGKTMPQKPRICKDVHRLRASRKKEHFADSSASPSPLSGAVRLDEG